MTYTVNYNLTRTSTTGNTTVQISPDTDYKLPSSISVSNATLVSYDSTTGVAVLSGVSENTTIECECPDIPTRNNTMMFYVNSHQATPFTLTMQGGKTWDGTLKYYNVSNDEWIEWDGSAISGQWDGEKTVLYLRGTGNSYITGNGSSLQPTHYFNINSGSTVFISGNIWNLIDWLSVKNKQLSPDSSLVANSSYAFSSLFYGAASIDIDNLVCEWAPEGCYLLMFSGSSITTPPRLPAETISPYCYYRMFNNCVNLTSIPELPARDLKIYCYNMMFIYCSKIKMSTSGSSTYANAYRIPSSGRGTPVNNATTSMFTNTGGTFTGTPIVNTTYYTSNTIVPANS